MLRWHSKHCITPDVFPAGDDTLSCSDCETLLNQDLKKNSHPSKNPSFPKSHDATLNLTWPNSVRYEEKCILTVTVLSVVGYIRLCKMVSSRANNIPLLPLWCSGIVLAFCAVTLTDGGEDITPKLIEALGGHECNLPDGSQYTTRQNGPKLLEGVSPLKTVVAFVF